MKQLVQLFLRREHLILMAKILNYQQQILDMHNSKQLRLLFNWDYQNQKSEAKLLRQIRLGQNELEEYQMTVLQIVNLSFCYLKSQLPANCSLALKDHIKFCQSIRQINYGGISIEDLIRQQRIRLQNEKMVKAKFLEEPIQSKFLTCSFDIKILAQLQNTYFHSRNYDTKQQLSVLNLNNNFHKIARLSGKEVHCIMTVEDIPTLQLINTSLIQPILNYETYNQTFEHKMQKLMARNVYIQQTIKQYLANGRPRVETPVIVSTTRSFSDVKPEHQFHRMVIQPKTESVIEVSSDRYQVQGKASTIKNLKFHTTPSCASSKNVSQERVARDHNLAISDHFRSLNTVKHVVKPINYQSLCFGSIDKKPQITDQDQQQNHLQLPIVTEPSNTLRNQIKISTRRYQEQQKQQSVQLRMLLNNNKQIPLLNSHVLQNLQEILGNYKSEQLITTLINSGSMRQKQSQIYQQFLQPIKISSQQKVLTPKDRLLTRSKFKNLRVETKYI